MRVCVFCASLPGRRPAYEVAAIELGVALAEAGHELVYGGGRVGLMGTLADAALAAGGRVTGVMPTPLVAAEIAHPGITDLRVVASMHERKAMMADLAEGFVALPGGFGTFDELFEILTWAQLGFHARPIVLLDVDAYWDALLALADRATEEGFVRPDHRSLLARAESAPEALALLATERPPVRPKWLGDDAPDPR